MALQLIHILIYKEVTLTKVAPSPDIPTEAVQQVSLFGAIPLFKYVNILCYVVKQNSIVFILAQQLIHRYIYQDVTPIEPVTDVCDQEANPTEVDIASLNVSDIMHNFV